MENSFAHQKIYQINNEIQQLNKTKESAFCYKPYLVLNNQDQVIDYNKNMILSPDSRKHLYK